ncbi:hypothetical protein [Mahella australiensis]|uniref:Uncharacterized protein n=1 Tax=Mahella australiensis (strain DSM 15567 / CIP 107919 / 50-1 BON) TaxID=697281 RepID=F3ZZE1_MAHA5|nr:hypothetical protein [Mahella australiensis]AEE95751.1 hypothetical protein Mahau_0547 [Mahella australiensis 50-1 BON]
MLIMSQDGEFLTDVSTGYITFINKYENRFQLCMSLAGNEAAWFYKLGEFPTLEDAQAVLENIAELANAHQIPYVNNIGRNKLC